MRWHSQVELGQCKMDISSENSAIVYVKMKKYSQWYRYRDFLLLRHVFKYNGSHYIIDKSIENTNFIPFQSIHRGTLTYQLIKLTPVGSWGSNQGFNPTSTSTSTSTSPPQTKMVMQYRVDYGGLLKSNQCRELAERYLGGFSRFEAEYAQKINQDQLLQEFRQDWCIDDSLNQNAQIRLNNISYRSDDFLQSEMSSELDDEQVFFSIDDVSDEEDRAGKVENAGVTSGGRAANGGGGAISGGGAPNGATKNGGTKNGGTTTEATSPPVTNIGNIPKLQKKSSLNQQEHQIQLPFEQDKPKQDIFHTSKEIIAVDSNGLVILPSKYLKHRHPATPLQTYNSARVHNPHPHVLLRDVWKRSSEGGFTLVNKKIIAAQDNVLKFIMSTLKKNLFSGKGIMNISLPVEIFNCDSNLQRLCMCLGYAPEYVQRAAKLTNQIQRMKCMVAFTLTVSLMYLDVEKPFNPILGETYQGLIAGCPIYGEQISHHPPISALYMVGRGYKIHAALESKVDISVNSASGSNAGWYHVRFDDGTEVCFHTCPGELGGLAFGERKYNMKGKSYIFMRNSALYCQINFEDQSGFFGSNKWKFKDQIQGSIVKVTNAYLDKFIQSFPDKKLSPGKNDILQTYVNLSGRWPDQLEFDQVRFLQVNQDMPFQLIDYPFPLNSNAIYREDLHYRRENDLARSQCEKERLEILQRTDRKFREKYHPAKH